MQFQIGELEEDLFDENQNQEEIEPSEEELKALEDEDENENEEDVPLEVAFAEESGNDIIRKYLNEIGKQHLLTREQEVELAQKIKNGDRESFEKFVSSNLRLVVKWAKRYSKNYHLKLLDCIQEGNLGLMKGVERYDWRRGFKFSTYGSWWIRQAIQRAIKDSDRTIRLPVHMSELLSKLQRTRRELTLSLGYSPSTFEIAQHMRITEELVVRLFRKMQDTKSLQDQLSDDKDAAEFGEILEDKNSCCPEKTAELGQIAEKLKQAIGKLSQQEQQVFLLTNIENLSNKSIAEKLGIRPGKVEEIRRVAMKKLRASSELKPYSK
ncbi:MAG: sigma-70 family RNA polymerase sigma factor [Candidatus Moranbacteria bacterium]|nr:sigma-70 family RNA polymerase sigma factor [Candidatus Moranbacteria bacterium]